MLGQLLTELAPAAGERALVVGAGTGYSAAVLAAMGCEVVALESSAELAARARELGVNVVEGPLDGRPQGGAPYDLILIDGAVEHLPRRSSTSSATADGSARRSSTAASPA